MKHYEKDALTLGLIHNFLKGTNKKITDYIPDFDQLKFSQFSETLSYAADDRLAEEALKYIAAECYNRIKKKFPKG